MTLGAWTLLEWLALAEHELLLFAGAFLLIGLIDELAIDLAWFWLRLNSRARTLRINRDNHRNGALEGPAALLIPAWQEALQLMRPGDEWMLYVPSNLGYGEEGAGGGEIPPGAPLIFRIELIDVLPAPGRIQQG